MQSAEWALVGVTPVLYCQRFLAVNAADGQMGQQVERRGTQALDAALPQQGGEGAAAKKRHDTSVHSSVCAMKAA